MKISKKNISSNNKLVFSHLMFEAGHWMFSRTLSHMSEARAWMHLPGHPSALAVLVTEPRKPAADNNI